MLYFRTVQSCPLGTLVLLASRYIDKIHSPQPCNEHSNDKKLSIATGLFGRLKNLYPGRRAS